MDMPLVLASASPRRLELLRSIALRPLVLPSGLPEDGHRGLPPAVRVVRLAEAKAHRVASLIAIPSLVLAADTEVVLDGLVMGKPRDEQDAMRMLGLLSGRTHEVLTGLCLLRTDDGRLASAAVCTRVRFRAYGEDVVRRYVATGEPADKAGAYGIQGRGALLADAIDGSWSNVVGLPLERLPDLFASLDLSIADFESDQAAPSIAS